MTWGVGGVADDLPGVGPGHPKAGVPRPGPGTPGTPGTPPGLLSDTGGNAWTHAQRIIGTGAGARYDAGAEDGQREVLPRPVADTVITASTQALSAKVASWPTTPRGLVTRLVSDLLKRTHLCGWLTVPRLAARVGVSAITGIRPRCLARDAHGNNSPDQHRHRQNLVRGGGHVLPSW